MVEIAQGGQYYTCSLKIIHLWCVDDFGPSGSLKIILKWEFDTEGARKWLKSLRGANTTRDHWKSCTCGVYDDVGPSGSLKIILKWEFEMEGPRKCLTSLRGLENTWVHWIWYTCGVLDESGLTGSLKVLLKWYVVTRGRKSVKVLLGGDQLVVLGPNISKIYSQSEILFVWVKKVIEATRGSLFGCF